MGVRCQVLKGFCRLNSFYEAAFIIPGEIKRVFVANASGGGSWAKVAVARVNQHVIAKAITPHKEVRATTGAVIPHTVVAMLLEQKTPGCSQLKRGLIEQGHALVRCQQFLVEQTALMGDYSK
jgi:hypothetical protein